jgi:hypothetical protein
LSSISKTWHGMETRSTPKFCSKYQHFKIRNSNCPNKVMWENDQNQSGRSRLLYNFVSDIISIQNHLLPQKFIRIPNSTNTITDLWTHHARTKNWAVQAPALPCRFSHRHVGPTRSAALSFCWKIPPAHKGQNPLAVATCLIVLVGQTKGKNPHRQETMASSSLSMNPATPPRRSAHHAATPPPEVGIHPSRRHTSTGGWRAGGWRPSVAPTVTPPHDHCGYPQG